MATLPRSDHASNQKRNLGFAPIRRGLLEHWSAMSVNARAFYIWLHLKAEFKGPRRGSVEASFDDMARGNRWSLKTTQRTIEELEHDGYVKVKRATNQYELTRVRILKFDPEESTSAMDKFDRSNKDGVDCAVDKFDCTTDRSKPSNMQSNQNLHPPKKVKELNNKIITSDDDAVRRPFDAVLHSSPTSFSPMKRKQNLEERLLEKGLKNRTLLDNNLDEEERAAFAAIGYMPRDIRKLAAGFVYAVEEMVDKHKGTGISPGNLCSKIIDHCQAQQECCKKLGASASDYYWPPDFQDHRDRLRAQERAQEKSASVRRSA